MGQITTASIGQLIAVENPSPNAEWQLDYESTILMLLTSPEDTGTNEWVFQAASVGKTDLSLTGDAASCAATPCPPAVVRFTFTVEVIP
jgi:hypothetical protein